MDKNKIKNKLKDDPAFSLEVQNPEVEELMVQYSSDKKAETLNKLIEKCTKSRFLVPANVGENNKPIPLFIKNGEGEAFMPIYTSKAQLSKDHPSPCIVNMPFLAVNNMVANKESKIDGIAFNPFTHNLIFKKPLVEKIEAVEKARREGHPTSPTKGKTVQMTAEQYVIFERMQYEHIFLPTKMFEGGKEFMDRLADEKEKLIDGEKFGIDPRKTASILDTFSCTIQGIIPYGVQILLAAGLAHVQPVDIIPYLYYPFAIGIAASLSILLRYPKRYS